MVNHFYVYAVDADFGPSFLKFGTYFPYNAKLCLNGHEYVKRPLAQRGIPYEALDNGIRSCADPRRVQALCDGLSAAKIEAFVDRPVNGGASSLSRQLRSSRPLTLAATT
jgi:hypothetical protein